MSQVATPSSVVLTSTRAAVNGTDVLVEDGSINEIRAVSIFMPPTRSDPARAARISCYGAVMSQLNVGVRNTETQPSAVTGKPGGVSSTCPGASFERLTDHQCDEALGAA
jgi:hypothetical protein